MEKIISLTIGGIYIILATIFAGSKGFLIASVFIFNALMLIWYSDFFADFIGFTHFRYISQKSPEILIKIFGWIFLIAPGIIVCGKYIHTWMQ